MKGSYDPRTPTSASVPIAVQTCAKSAMCTASFNARAATDAEKAVPFNIPKCSFDWSEIGSMLCSASALRDDTTLRAPKAEGPSNTRIEGLPMRVPAIYDKGERSICQRSLQFQEIRRDIKIHTA